MKISKIYIVIIIIIIVVLLAGFLLARQSFENKNEVSNYAVGNKYYSFQLQTPRGWVGEEKTIYSEDNIAKFLAECKKDNSSKSSVYEVGAFRFKSLRYPEDLIGSLSSSSAMPTGTIIEITVNCIPGSVESQGEKTVEDFIDLPVFGKTKQISLMHGDLQYKIREYVYVAPGDKGNEQRVRENYSETFNKIVASLKFSK